MFDPIKRTGELYQKIIYRKRCGKENLLKRVHPENENSCLSVDEIIKFFKDCILPRDRTQCIEMLKKSKMQRLNDLRQDKRILKSSFDLYISNPDLVILIQMGENLKTQRFFMILDSGGFRNSFCRS